MRRGGAAQSPPGRRDLPRRARRGAGGLSSDLTRKQLAGTPAAARAPQEVYRSEWNRRTYAELGHRTVRAVAEHRGAVVDATFRRALDRQAFASAFGGAAPVVFIECRAPVGVLNHRAAQRWCGARGVSDADPEVVRRERLTWEPLDEIPAHAHIGLRTDRPLPDIMDEIVALLDSRLQRLELGPQ